MNQATCTLKDAKARLSELIDRAEAGEIVTISRRGRIVAQLTASPRPRQPVDFDALRALSARLPPCEDDAGAFLQRLREAARY